MKKLAILGGLPALTEPAHVNLPVKPNQDELFGLIEGVLQRNNYSNNGPLVQNLEAKIARYLGVKHCVIVSNGTLALQILVHALGLKGEVIVPAFTFIATANALTWQQLEPKFCDIKPGTPNIDPDQCQRMITANTSAILGVHVWGQRCDTDALEHIARENGIPLIFDAAHAFGCGDSTGRMIGTYGDAEVFSFHATKAFHSAEGGAITTNDDSLAIKLKQIRNFGFVDTDKTDCLGINAKMSEIHAAVGLSNHSHLEQSLEKSVAVYATYIEKLKIVEHIELLKFSPPHNFHYVVVRVKDEAPLDRDQLIDVLCKENILARRYFYPGCHRMEPYYSDSKRSSLPETEKLASSTLLLPAGAQINLADVSIICDTLIAIFDSIDELLNHLERQK